MISIRCFVLAAGMSCAAAHAQFSYDLGGIQTQLASSDDIRATGNPNLFESLTVSPNTGETLFGPDVRTFQRNFTLNTSTYPTILSAQSSMNLTTQAAPNRFAFSWTASESGAIVGLAPDVSRFREIAMNLFTGVNMTMTQNATVRVTWEAMTTGFVGGGPGDLTHPRNASTGTLGGTGLPSSFTFGYGNPSLNVQSNFSFDVNVLAGQTISLNANTALTLRNEAFVNLNNGSWNQSSSGSFVVEVIPAPSCAAALATGMCVLSRRRRR